MNTSPCDLFLELDMYGPCFSPSESEIAVKSWETYLSRDKSLMTGKSTGLVYTPGIHELRFQGGR